MLLKYFFWTHDMKTKMSDIWEVFVRKTTELSCLIRIAVILRIAYGTNRSRVLQHETKKR